MLFTQAAVLALAGVASASSFGIPCVPLLSQFFPGCTSLNLPVTTPVKSTSSVPVVTSKSASNLSVKPSSAIPSVSASVPTARASSSSFGTVSVPRSPSLVITSTTTTTHNSTTNKGVLTSSCVSTCKSIPDVCGGINPGYYCGLSCPGAYFGPSTSPGQCKTSSSSSVKTTAVSVPPKSISSPSKSISGITTIKPSVPTTTTKPATSSCVSTCKSIPDVCGGINPGYYCGLSCPGQYFGPSTTQGQCKSSSSPSLIKTTGASVPPKSVSSPSKSVSGITTIKPSSIPPTTIKTLTSSCVSTCKSIPDVCGGINPGNYCGLSCPGQYFGPSTTPGQCKSSSSSSSIKTTALSSPSKPVSSPPKSISAATTSKVSSTPKSVSVVKPSSFSSNKSSFSTSTRTSSSSSSIKTSPISSIKPTTSKTLSLSGSSCASTTTVTKFTTITPALTTTSTQINSGVDTINGNDISPYTYNFVSTTTTSTFFIDKSTTGSTTITVTYTPSVVIGTYSTSTFPTPEGFLPIASTYPSAYLKGNPGYEPVQKRDLLPRAVVCTVTTTSTVYAPASGTSTFTTTLTGTLFAFPEETTTFDVVGGETAMTVPIDSTTITATRTDYPTTITHTVTASTTTTVTATTTYVQAACATNNFADTVRLSNGGNAAVIGLSNRTGTQFSTNTYPSAYECCAEAIELGSEVYGWAWSPMEGCFLYENPDFGACNPNAPGAANTVEYESPAPTGFDFITGNAACNFITSGVEET